MSKRLTDKQYIKTAQRFHACEEGILEVDDAAKVSWGDDDGAYVQAWIWVRDDEAKATP